MKSWYLPVILQTFLLPITVITDADKQACRSSIRSTELIILNCSHTVLSDLELPGSSKQTTVLDLSYSSVDRLPAIVEATTFPNLVHLNLSHNLIKGNIHDLKYISANLRTVDFSFNNLQDMTGFICPPKLTTLSLDNNVISVMQLDANCIKLKELYIQNNDIADMQLVISNDDGQRPMFELQILNISCNKLTHVKENHFIPFEKLQKLYLANNGIADIAESSFTKLTYLEIVDLSNNELTVLPHKLFSKNEYLKYLDLSRNSLQTLPSNLPMLDWVDVSYNRISVVTEDSSSLLYPVRVFLIGGNPLKCTCEMMWLKELFNVRKYLMKYLKTIDSTKFIPVCDKPEKLKGKSWDNLTDDVFECSIETVDQDSKSTNEKIANVLNQKDVLKTTEITQDTINVKWNIISTVHVDSVELSYYPFGKKKESLKTIQLSSGITSFSIKMLEANTPYILCLSVRLETPLTDCIEVITKEQPVTGVMFILVSIVHILKARLDLVMVTIGILTLFYIIHLVSTK